jgi:hypothetical protein
VRSTSRSRCWRYAISSATEIMGRRWAAAKVRISGPRLTVPSSFTSSPITPASGRPASRARSTAASVWPERSSTPPSLAISGKTWPGRTKSSALALALASARTVLQRSSAEMPVVRPKRQSTETVKAVPIGASFSATMGSSLSRRASAGPSGAQRIPQVWRIMKAMLLGRSLGRRHDEVALVLAVVVVDHDDHPALGDRPDRLLHRPHRAPPFLLVG